LDSLKDLADLIHQRNEIEMRIGDILGRPVHPGHFGEYVASRIFNIQLHTNASHKRSDGLFTSGPLLGKSVNIKFYTRGNGLLDLVASYDPLQHADHYLVLTGPASGAVTSKNTHALWQISAVYLFSSTNLLKALSIKPVSVGIATSLRKHLWMAAKVFPVGDNSDPPLNLNQFQIDALSLFNSSASNAHETSEGCGSTDS